MFGFVRQEIAGVVALRVVVPVLGSFLGALRARAFQSLHAEVNSFYG